MLRHKLVWTQHFESRNGNSLRLTIVLLRTASMTVVLYILHYIQHLKDKRLEECLCINMYIYTVCAEHKSPIWALHKMLSLCNGATVYVLCASRSEHFTVRVRLVTPHLIIPTLSHGLDCMLIRASWHYRQSHVLCSWKADLLNLSRIWNNWLYLVHTKLHICTSYFALWTACNAWT